MKLFYLLSYVFIHVSFHVAVSRDPEDVVKFTEGRREGEGYVMVKTAGIWISVCYGNQAAVDAVCRWSGYQIGIRDRQPPVSAHGGSGTAQAWKFDINCPRGAEDVGSCKLLSCSAGARLYAKCIGYPACSLPDGRSIPGNTTRILDNNKICTCGRGASLTCRCIQRTCRNGKVGTFDEDCKMICPEISVPEQGSRDQESREETPRGPTSRDKNVVEVSPECHDNLNTEYCATQRDSCHRRVLQKQCARTCGMCGTSVDQCTDTYDNEICRAWERKGACARNNVRNVCRKSCGVCEVEAATADIPSDGCQDRYDTCKLLTARGQCANSPLVRKWCPLSCRECEAPREDIPEKKDAPKPEKEKEERKGSSDKDSVKDVAGKIQDKLRPNNNVDELMEQTGSTISCTDKRSERFCSFAKLRNSCSINMAVLEGCARSCGVCQEMTGENCRDLYDIDSCRIWRNNGRCTSDPKVRRYCAATCGVCTIVPNPKTCTDTFNDRLCGFYRSSGYCTNPAHRSSMETRCARTCNLCPSVTCEDTVSGSTCSKWRDSGSCKINSAVREKLCAKTCGTC